MSKVETRNLSFASKDPNSRKYLVADSQVHTYTFEDTTTEWTEEKAYRFLKLYPHLKYIPKTGRFVSRKKDKHFPAYRFQYSLLLSAGVHKFYCQGKTKDFYDRLNRQITRDIRELSPDSSDTFQGSNFMNFVFYLRYHMGHSTPVWFIPKSVEDTEVSMSVSGGGSVDYFTRGRSKFHSSHKKVKAGDKIKSHANYRLTK